MVSHVSMLCGLFLLTTPLAAQRAGPPLNAPQIETLTLLLQLEDMRTFGYTTLSNALRDPHPEVRRRAAQTLGRVVVRDSGFALLRAHAGDRDTAVAATIVWAVGQLKDTTTVAWLDSVLRHRATPATARAEAATALGKIKNQSAGAALIRFLSAAPGRPGPGVGEAILALGRMTERPSLRPIHAWASATDSLTRWQVAWTLSTSRDPADLPMLLTLSQDPSPLVRAWTMRGLAKARTDSLRRLDPTSPVPTRAVEVLLSATRDTDRRVQTDALRALATYPEEPRARSALQDAMGAPDIWVATIAIEGLAGMRRPDLLPVLRRATAQGRPCPVRVIALQALQQLDTLSASQAAFGVVYDPAPHCRLTALQMVARSAATRQSGSVGWQVVQSLRTDPDEAVRLLALQTLYGATDTGTSATPWRAARQTALRQSDPVVRVAALRSMASWADTTDLPLLRATWEEAGRDSLIPQAAAVVAVIAAMDRRYRGTALHFLLTAPIPTARPELKSVLESGLPATLVRQVESATTSGTLLHPLAHYRALVDRWIVPFYHGAPRPQAEWETPRGLVTLELYPEDAPFGMAEFERLVTTGAVVGTPFTRVVPHFVNQQATIPAARRLRDEVSRRGLLRANLSWASAGLDTGRPGYTLGHTHQVHNEGDFTALGRVIGGLDVMDRLHLGDRVLAARMLPPSRP